MVERNDKGQFVAKYEIDTYEDIYNNYAEWVKVTVDKETTRTRLEDDLRPYLHWCEENDVHPYEAVERDVRRYIKQLRLNKDAPTTITRRVASVSKYYHTILNDPDIELDIDENPVADISLPKDFEIKNTAEYVTILRRAGQDDIVAVDYEVLKPLFDHVPGKTPPTRTRNELMCRLLWQTALRGDEMSRIRCDNIDWERREIKIRSSKLNEEDHELYIRRVWWEPELDLLMRRWYDSHRSQLNNKANDEYFFIGAANGHEKDDVYDYKLTPSTISRIVKEAADNAGIQEPLTRDTDDSVKQWLYTAHRLRHSRITHLCNKVDDLSIHFVRMLAGHEDISTTLDYVRNDWDEAREHYQDAVY
jgi:integrase/recombinase XerD